MAPPSPCLHTAIYSLGLSVAIGSDYSPAVAATPDRWLANRKVNAASPSPRPSGEELNDVPRVALTDFLWSRRRDGLPGGGGATPLRAPTFCSECVGDKEEADGEHASDTGGVRAALCWFSHWCRRPLACCEMSFSSMEGKGRRVEGGGGLRGC